MNRCKKIRIERQAQSTPGHAEGPTRPADVGYSLRASFATGVLYCSRVWGASGEQPPVVANLGFGMSRLRGLDRVG